ncbi:MAG: T9SS type A sorting domain-containing protein, partial [bacterium]
PNPFNSSTKIFFDLPLQSNVKVMVYSITGQHIKTLTDNNFPAGRNSVVWDGTSPNGTDSSSGVYVYRIQAGNYVQTGKMLLLR